MNKVLEEIKEEISTAFKTREHSCWIFHQWGKWVDVIATISGILYKTPRQIYAQIRYCRRCNKREINF